MNPQDTLTTLFSHNLWANQLLMEQCNSLTTEQLETTIPGTFGSIHATLEHIVTAEKSYFSRLSTGQPYRHPKDAPALTITEMIEWIRTSGVGLIELAVKVQAEDTVQINWDGTPRDLPMTILLTQAINHATEHRAQIMVIMTQLGIQPPELDSWTYFEELLK